MTDNAPGWQTDPTGRHDHRYWDGSQWTEHVSDAGVATTDPYDGPAVAAGAPSAPAEPDVPATDTGAEPTAVTEPSGGTEPEPEPEPEPEAQPEPEPEPEPAAPVAVPDPDAPSPFGTEPAASTSWPSDPDAPSAAEPEAATDTPAEPEPTVVAPGSTVPSYSSPVPPLGEATSAADEPTVVDAPAVAPDAPTTEQPAVQDITAAWPVAPSSADAPPPPVFTPPVVGDGGEGSGDGGSKKKVLIGVALLAIVAIVVGVIALSGGDDKEDLRTRIANEIREGGQSGLDQEEAECLADELIDDLGADKLDGVDFTASEPPEEIAEELNESFVDAIPTCDIDLSDSVGDEGDGDDDTDTTEGGETTDTSLTPEQIDEFRDLLAEQYRSTLGLTEDQSNCLADTMADAIEAGELSEQDSFDQFFEYLDACDISVSDLGGAAGAG